VVEPGVLDDVQHRLEWWYRDSAGEGLPLAPPRARARSGSFSDYTVLPWFVVPRGTGGRHVTGPYAPAGCAPRSTG
jgi:hypothetical protein